MPQQYEWVSKNVWWSQCNCHLQILSKATARLYVGGDSVL